MRSLTLIISLILIIMISGFECNNSRDITFCGIKDPLKNIAWVKERIENADKIEVSKWTYNDKEYFAIDPCPGCPDSMLEIFDCNGDRFCTIGGITGRNTCPLDFFENSEKILVLKIE